jgi:hypothetical protein
VTGTVPRHRPMADAFLVLITIPPCSHASSREAGPSPIPIKSRAIRELGGAMPVGSRTGAVFRRLSLSVRSPFPLGVPQKKPNRELVSNPRHIARSVWISRTTRTCSLRVKSYIAYRAGAALATDQRTSR